MGDSLANAGGVRKFPAVTYSCGSLEVGLGTHNVGQPRLGDVSNAEVLVIVGVDFAKLIQDLLHGPANELSLSSGEGLDLPLRNIDTVACDRGLRGGATDGGSLWLQI